MTCCCARDTALIRWDKDGLEEASALLNQALDLDPTFAEAAAELAYTYEKQEEAGYMLPTAASPQLVMQRKGP